MKLLTILFFLMACLPQMGFGQKENLFKPGCYYDLNNNKVSGFIHYAFDYRENFKFKENQEANIKKIRVGECKGFVMEKDSFTVIEDFNMEGVGGGLNGISLGFVQVIEAGKIVLYKHFSTQGNPNPYAFQAFSLVNYLLKSHSSAILIRKRSTKKFKEQMTNLLKANPVIVEKINNETYKWEDMPTIVKEYNSNKE